MSDILKNPVFTVKDKFQDEIAPRRLGVLPVCKLLTDRSEIVTYAPPDLAIRPLDGIGLDFSPENSLSQKVIGCINNLLSENRCTLILVADRLSIHPRTLQRHLAKLGLEYEECVTNVRRSRARLLLCESELTISEIARELGYLRVTSFCRAHQRWFGISPLEHRLRLKS
ncbi:helix-turn-helix transcriptional regulator [Pseudomonas faucium]|uniref:helix-turn-helix transcriptional regulator n=1 Tax=Pseudomonas faucium TaxID=2740518 RepID=UPI001596BF3E